MECLKENINLFDMFKLSNKKHELIYEMIINYDSLSDNYFLVILTGNNKDIAFEAEISFWWEDELSNDFIPPKIRNWKTIAFGKSLELLEQNINNFSFKNYFFNEDNKEIKVTENNLKKHFKKTRINIQRDMFINNFKYSPGYCVKEFQNEFELVYKFINNINYLLVDKSSGIQNSNVIFGISNEDIALRNVILQSGLNYNKLNGRQYLMYNDGQLYTIKKILLRILEKEIGERFNKFKKVFNIDDITIETIPLSLELENKILN